MVTACAERDQLVQDRHVERGVARTPNIVGPEIVLTGPQVPGMIGEAEDGAHRRNVFEAKIAGSTPKLREDLDEIQPIGRS